MKIRYFDVPRLVTNTWGVTTYTTLPEIVYCCTQAQTAPEVFQVEIGPDGRIVASLWGQVDGEDDEYPLNFCPWRGTPINEEGS